ncbi:MAG: hypothetical protein DRJ51_01185 [Thermoprotei archaeon]|nr:MAG: hypothetical protein DRJ51_01185 [Thermoprotei archaeon]RLF03355.1 MAG: hypothetical protein DRJ59_00880 [Thermoprotei archaeon]
MLFKDFVEIVKKLERTKSRLEKINLIVYLLKNLEPDEIGPAMWLLTGKIFPEYSDLKLEVGWSSVSKAYRSTRGIVSLVERKLTLKEVHEYLRKISLIKGEDSRRRKQRLLETLFVSLGQDELEYLVRFIFGEPRVGANEGLVLEALAKIAGVDIETVRKAYMFRADLGELAEIAVLQGEEGLQKVKLELFRPVKPMLAEMLYDVRAALRECGGIAAFEFKYDGIRLQIHKKGDRVRLFTRRLTEVTESLPDVVKLVKEHVHAHEIVLDCEAMSFKNGKPVRFQDLVRRIRRKHEMGRLMRELPFEIRVFDVLYLDGRILVEKPYKERTSLLEEIVDEELLIERIITADLQEAKDFYQKSIGLGHEGLMAKRLDSPYMPGIRGKYWFKVKPAETLDLVIIGAEWGHGRRRGWLSDYYLAALDEETGEFLVVGKTFKGLTDEEFKEMTKRLLELKVREEGWRVWVKPQIVVEVAYSEIQKSPKYRSGLALRFARIVRIRYDKSPWEASTIGEIRRRYEEQFEKKAKISS